MTAPLLEARGITKRFPGVVANDAVDLTVRAREIHAVVGENGAGKSTLMKILYGLLAPDAGEIRLRGRPAAIRSPRDAIRLGIGMVHQHFMLIPRFTVAENVVLGHENGRAGVIHPRAVAERVGALARRYGLGLDPRAPVAELSVGEQQRVEILKVLYRGAEILVLDEPTAVLAPQEVGELFANLRTLRDQGKTIVFISHKLDEVLALADRITVLRRGRVVGTVGATTPRERLAELMVGRPVFLQIAREPVAPGPPLLEVENLVVPGPGGRPAVHGVSLRVRAGETYGLAGVEGNGQAELVGAVLGLRRVAAGAVRIGGRLVAGPGTRPGSSRAAREAGVAVIPEDRHREGLVLAMRLWENVVLGRHRRPPFARRGFLDFRAIFRYARDLVAQFDVRVHSIHVPALTLSGGNQQKAIIARELAPGPRVVVAAQPTRGLDVGATEFVRQQLMAARSRGAAILLVSADLEEVLSLSDRVGVMYGGRLVGEWPADTVDLQVLGERMVGGQAPASAGSAVGGGAGG